MPSFSSRIAIHRNVYPKNMALRVIDE